MHFLASVHNFDEKTSIVGYQGQKWFSVTLLETDQLLGAKEALCNFKTRSKNW